MFRNLLATTVKTTPSSILYPIGVQHEQLRTTFILKRRHPYPLYKEGLPLKKPRQRHFIYDLIKNTHNEPTVPIDVILTQYVEGIGNIGDKVSVKPHYAYHKLLIPGLAVYATLRNEEKFKNFRNEEAVVHSSKYAQYTADTLSRKTLSIVLNRESPWTLKPWHVRTAFRRCGFCVPEDTITMPSKTITGPNMDIEGKDFYITVTINNFEKATVRCRIHHWSTEISDRLPYEFEFWKKSLNPLFPEDQPVLESLPSNHQPQDSASTPV